MYTVDQLADCLFVEVHIGDGGEQPRDHQPPCVGVDRGIAVCGSGQPDECARQLVLKFRHIGGLAADTGLPGAAGAAHCLFTLKAKHLVIHLESLSFFNQVYFRPWKWS